MPPQRLSPLSQTATQIFVDREEPKRNFEKAVRTIPRKGCILRTWYGVGGQGKTALARELFRASSAEVEPRYKHLRRAMLDLHQRPLTDADRLMVWIRNAFSKAGVSFPAFDLAFAMMWEKTRAEEPLPKFENPWLFRTGEAFADSLPDAVTLTREMIETTAETIPLLGTLMKKGSGWAFERGKRAWLARTRPQLQAFYRDGNLIQEHEMSDLMPWMLAQDLKQHLESHPEDRFVLFIDEYERVMEGAGTIARWQDNRFDTHLQKFVAETDGLLALFFSREKLHWEGEIDWREDLKGNQHPLRGLNDEDADNWLSQVPIKNESIRAAMIAGAKETGDPSSLNYPLMLDLQVEHWRNLGSDSVPEDFLVGDSTFEKRHLTLVRRLLRDYDANTQELLSRLSLAQRFDLATVEHVIKTFSIPVSISVFDLLSNLSLMSIDDYGWLSPNRVVAAAILQANNETMNSSSLEALLCHFEDRAQPSLPADVTDETLFCFRQAARLRLQMGLDGYVSWATDKSEVIQEAHRARFMENFWRETLDNTVECFGDAHPDVATSIIRLAGCLKQQLRCQAAELLVRELLEKHREALTALERGLEEAHYTLAVNLNCQGKFLEAEEIGLATLERLFDEADGAPAYHVCLFYQMLAHSLTGQGRDSEAEFYFRESQKIALENGDNEDLLVAEGYVTIAVSLTSQKRFNEAETYCRKALTTFELMLSETDPRVAAAHHQLGITLYHQNRHEEAETSQSKALEIYRLQARDILRRDLSIYEDLASPLGAQEKFQEAEELLREALKIADPDLDETLPQIISLYLKLAEVLRELEKDSEAEKMLREALRIGREKLDDTDLMLKKISAHMIQILCDQNRLDELEPFYLMIAEMMGLPEDTEFIVKKS